MLVSELDYVLPPERIATTPAEPRDAAKLLVYRRGEDRIEHCHFYDLPDLLAPRDLLVLNNTKVLPAKLMLRKQTGAAIPGLFLSSQVPGQWRVMLRSRGKLNEGATLLTDPESPYQIRLIEKLSDKGQWLVDVTPADETGKILTDIGHVPLPPYIEKSRGGTTTEEEKKDRQRYQTIYARERKAEEGSLAAPTAGLHFTPAVFERLIARQIERTEVTLQVGLGTFLPVETEFLEDHPMHEEHYFVSAGAIERLRRQRAQKNRIVVVGTTATRTLEAAAERILGSNPPADISASTRLLISPGYQLKLTDVLITNFHLPRSTLIALVAALIPLPRLKEIYAQAISNEYRFYSYGDAMIVLP